MGQTYCVTLCGQNPINDQNSLSNVMNHDSDEPIESFAKKVKQHIELHPSIKEVYILYRTPHNPQKKGVKLELYYLFQFSAYYEGEWKNGLPHGFGRVIYDDGSIYQGCFNAGIASCHQALFIRKDGCFYRGTIHNNKANGYGQLSTPKLFYKGNWVNDIPNGHARQIYSSVSFYQGDFVNGTKQGKGIYQWNSGEYYKGQFNNNKMEGEGQLKMRQYSYRGGFKNGMQCGKGIYTCFLNNFVFQGIFQKNIAFGQGKLTYQDGAIFNGIFQGFDKRKGTLTLLTGETIEVNVFEQLNQQDPSEIILQQSSDTLTEIEIGKQA